MQAMVAMGAMGAMAWATMERGLPRLRPNPTMAMEAMDLGLATAMLPPQSLSPRTLDWSFPPPLVPSLPPSPTPRWRPTLRLLRAASPSRSQSSPESTCWASVRLNPTMEAGVMEA